MKALLLNGSPAMSSHTRATLNYLSELISGAGSTSEIIDLLDLRLLTNDPIYHADAMQSPNEKVRDLAQKVKNSDLIVLGTPLYHGSYSGLLKTALDNLDGDAFFGKKVLIVSNSSGARGAMQAAQHLVVVPRTMGGFVYERLIGTCKADFELSNDKYKIISEEITSRCKAIISEIISMEQK